MNAKMHTNCANAAAVDVDVLQKSAARGGCKVWRERERERGDLHFGGTACSCCSLVTLGGVFVFPVEPVESL